MQNVNNIITLHFNNFSQITYNFSRIECNYRKTARMQIGPTLVNFNTIILLVRVIDTGIFLKILAQSQL